MSRSAFSLRFRPFVVCGFGALLLVAAWAPGARASDDDVALLTARATRFWEARVQDDWKVVFELTPPEEQAAMGNRDTWAAYQQQAGPIRYHRARVYEAFVQKDLGWVRVEFASSPRLYAKLPPTDVTTWQVWQKRDDWRPVPRQVSDQFPTRPPQARPAEEEATLAKRVDELWNAQAAGDYGRMYDFLEPAYRAATPREEFLARKARYLYSGHTIQWTEVTGDKGRVKIAFTRKLNDPTLYKLDPEQSTTFENWLKIDGQWFRSMEPPKGSH